jgi:RecB family endonuclease NucS
VTGGRDLTLHGSEEDLRTRILERPELVEPGFEPRETERPSSAGPMDIFGVDADGVPVVVELKRRRVGPDAVGQLARYVRALREELGGEERADTGGDNATPAVRGVLVAPSVTDRAAERLADRGFDHVALDPTPAE